MGKTTDNFLAELDEWERNKVMSKYANVTRKQTENSGIVIYGGSVIGKDLASRLIACGIRSDWIVDKNPDLHGMKFLDVEIRPVESLLDIGERFVLIGTTHVNEVIDKLSEYEVDKWILSWAIKSFCPLLGQWGKTMCVNLVTDELINGIELFNDEKSQDIYKAFVRYHFTYENDFSALRDPIDYFPNDLADLIDYGRFVDCGAFDGDTLKIWAERELFSSSSKDDLEYWAFEPDRNNFEKLKKYVCTFPAKYRSGIHLFNAGVSIKATDNFLGANIDGGDCCVNEAMEEGMALRSIDDALKQCRPTVIKADIEGFELDMLRGAEKTIRRCRPTLIIKVYHKFEDIYEIPNWIANLGLDYDLYLRHAPAVFTDTAVYAIPRK
jgi:FkbM family methyltransferase